MLMDNLFMISLGVLIVLTIFVLGLVFYFAMRRSDAKATASPQITKLRFDSLRSSFRQGVELIEGSIATRAERYSIPWVMVLSEGLDQGQLPIEQSGVPSALSSEAVSAAATQGISWHFFDRGVVIDIQGVYLGSPDDEAVAERPWDEFLGLCSKYRPQRPFDSVVITVPITLLTDESPDARLELAKLAKLAHRRLWLAQNRFAMRFPVYVVVSGCDKIEGFSAFARSLPDSVKASMLGWSSPYDLSTTYQSTWVDDAVDCVVKTVSDTSAELFALNSISDETAKFFLLPSRLATIRSQLQLYVDELMRPSAYHEPFFFRGIYLTGDSSEAAQKAVGMAAGMTPGAVDDDDRLDGDRIEPQIDMVSRMMRQPAFLRDLFEKKVFLEYGLARPSRSQQLTRPVLGRVARWAAIIFVGVWCIGLVVATFQLKTRNAELAVVLAQIQASADVRARAEERGIPIPAEWYRKRALALLAAIDQLGADDFWAVFMPGSWRFFDDLSERVAERIEREFGEIAINTLRRELYAKASELTGVMQEPSTGELVTGGDCAAPRGLAELREAPRRVSLALEDLPEYAVMMQYLGSVEQLDLAINAMASLRKPSPTAAADFRFLVKYALGADLPGDATKSIRYFRDDPTVAGQTPAAISVEPIRLAAQCSFARGMKSLDKRLFDGNDLIAAERRINETSIKLLSVDAQPLEFQEIIDGYRVIRDAVKEQDSLLGPGKGAWMRQPGLVLGPSYDNTLARAGKLRLLGAELAERVRQETAAAFQKFSVVFTSYYGPLSHSGVVWAEKEARFALSPERQALREALTTLLVQPFMAPPKERELPEVGADMTLVWATPRLDQAIALGDARKRYFSEGLLKFPQDVRPNIEAVINSQFSHLVNEYTTDALTLSVRSDPAASPEVNAFEAARVRLVKIQALLTELDAADAADDLRKLISQDAAIRLRQVDDNLLRSDVYAINVLDFKSWKGDRGRLLHAFGVQDVPALQQYLGLQFGRVEALGKQAEVYIASLDGRAANRAVPQRWQAINRDLDRYRLKNPNSSLVALEQFLTTSISDLDRSNCVDKLVGKGPSRPIDYFGERHAQIFTAISTRCNELSLQHQHEQWSTFAGHFNQLVAGRLPFGQWPPLTLGRPAANDVLFADFDEVGQVLKTYDQVAKTLKEIKDARDSKEVKDSREPKELKEPREAASEGRADTSTMTMARSLQGPRRFVDQFERARIFLAALYPADEGAVPGYDVAVEFRANPQSEVAGNKIIEWSLEIGGQVITHRDAPRVLRWEYRTPITVSMRLAKNSLTSPLADDQQPEMNVDGKLVKYSFTDPWSLLSMIQRQRESDGAGRVDKRSVLLRWEFPTTTLADNPNAPAIDGRSKVYLRLVISPVGKKTPLIWPGSFPVKAPEWVE